MNKQASKKKEEKQCLNSSKQKKMREEKWQGRKESITVMALAESELCNSHIAFDS